MRHLVTSTNLRAFTKCYNLQQQEQEEEEQQHLLNLQNAMLALKSASFVLLLKRTLRVQWCQVCNLQIR